MIPLTSDRIPDSAVQSVLKQSCKCFEIIILQNDVSSMPEEMEVREKELPIHYAELPMRKLQIRSRGKGNALNIGIKYARYELVCVLDADCILKHWNMVLNPKLGMLGLLAMPYQLFVELLGPIFVLLHAVNLICATVDIEWWFEITVTFRRWTHLDSIPQMWELYLMYLVFEISLTCIAEYLEYG